MPREGLSKPGGVARPAWRRRALEAIGLAVACGLLPELARARLGGVLEPHPGWIAVAVLAARGGAGGLLAGLVATAFAVGIGSAVAGNGLAATYVLDSGPNLIAFGACLLVSWAASWHLRRQADLTERLRTLSDRATEAKATIEALSEAVAMLRRRADRTATSLSFVREVAGRLMGGDPVAAAEAAADLALARTGASAAAIRVGVGRSRHLLAVRDARGSRGLAPLALYGADRCEPIRNGGVEVGDITLWGIPGPALDEAMAHDLEVVASWCAPALATAAWRAGETGSRAGDAIGRADGTIGRARSAR